MVGGAQDVDLEEGLEEALESLSLDHVTRVSCHVTPESCHVTPTNSQLKDVSLLPPPFREQRLSTKVSQRSCDCHMILM